MPAGHVAAPAEHCWHTGPPAPAGTPSALQPVAMSHMQAPGAGPTQTVCGAEHTHTALPFTGFDEPAGQAMHFGGGPGAKPFPGEPPRQPQVVWPACVLAVTKDAPPEGQPVHAAEPATAETVPAAQGVQDAAPAAEKVPAAL